ncbi:hypothetical protein GYB22_04740 [bacterium]|nr:hypothetical protein [bacterium]
MTFGLFSCSSKPQKEEKAPKLVSKEIVIDFADAKMPIHPRFERLSVDQYKSKLEASELSKDIKSFHLSRLKFQDDQLGALELYVDKDNPKNQVWFIQGPHEPVTYEGARVFISLMGAQLRAMFAATPFNVEKIDSRFFYGNKSSGVKVKYFLEVDKFSQYFTQYIMSSEYQTLGIIVHSDNEEDLQEYIKRIQL